MSRLDDRLERDLRHIADRATPSSTAWEAIQARVAEQADYTELEITMLKPNPKPNPPARTWILGAAAAALLVIAGLYFALSGGDDNSLPVTETDTSVPATTEAPVTTAVASTDADIAVAEDFIAARNDYDGEAVTSIVASDATISGIDFIDSAAGYVLHSEYEQALGVTILDPQCTVGSPGRVSCTYQAESAQSVALGVGPYNGRFVLVVEDGQIVQVNNNIGDAQAYGEEVFVPFQTWLAETHPDDRFVLYDQANNPMISAETVLLWAEYTDEFVAFVQAPPEVPADARATIEEFLGSTDMDTLRSVLTESAFAASGESAFAADADTWLISRLVLGVDPEVQSCAPVGDEGSIRCQVSLPSNISEAFGQEPRVRGVTFDFMDGRIDNWPIVLSGPDFDEAIQAAVSAGFEEQVDALCQPFTADCADFVMANLDELAAAVAAEQ